MSESSALPEKLLQNSARISLAVSSLVLAVKFAGYFATHSESILSDSVESVVNVVSAFVAVIVMRAVAEPADSEHPYGHGKLEYFSAAVEGGLVAFAGLSIIFSALESFWHPVPLQNLATGLIFLAISTVLNVGLSWYLFQVSRKYQSEALRASAVHIRSDVVTTLGIIVGVGVVWLTGLKWLDNVLALAVGLYLMKEGSQIIRRSAGALIDESNSEILEDLAESFQNCRGPGLIDIHKVRVIRSGRFHHVDAHLVVPEIWSIKEAHEISQNFEQHVMREYSHSGEIAFHLDPCKRQYCKVCDFNPCPIRIKNFVGLRKFEANTLTREEALPDVGI
jgi:cation diffusion facilitator family transporter